MESLFPWQSQGALRPARSTLQTKLWPPLGENVFSTTSAVVPLSPTTFQPPVLHSPPIPLVFFALWGDFALGGTPGHVEEEGGQFLCCSRLG